MKQKTFTLSSGKENEWGWSIICSVFSNGSFNNKGVIKTENRKENYIDYKETIINNVKGWQLRNEEKVILYKKRWRTKNEVKIKEERNINREKYRNWFKDWKALHQEYYKETQNEYYHKHREEYYERNNKRKGLGFNPLNDLIEGIECDAHHINNDDVIYIPTIIHQRISHNLKTNKNMKLINSIAEGFK